MDVIRHAVDCDQFLAFSSDNSGDVLFQIFAMLRGYHTRTTRDREDSVQINLRIGVGHVSELHMTLLAELIIEAFFGTL